MSCLRQTAVIVVWHGRRLLEQAGESIHATWSTAQGVGSCGFGQATIAGNQARDPKVPGLNGHQTKVLTGVGWNDSKAAAADSLGLVSLRKKTWRFHFAF
jgi:hypothetical protein